MKQSNRVFRWAALLCGAMLPGLTASGQAPSAAPVRVACVGDSITFGYGIPEGKSYPSQLQEILGNGWNVRNFGVSGRTLLRKGDFPYWNEPAFQEAKAFSPDVVVIMLGTNDTKPQNWAHSAEFVADYRDLVKAFQELPSKPRVFVCRPCPIAEPGNFGLSDADIQRVLLLVDSFAREEKLEVIDIHGALAPHPEMFPDKVHPDAAGAAIMARTVAAVLTAKAKEAP